MSEGIATSGWTEARPSSRGERTGGVETAELLNEFVLWAFTIAIRNWKMKGKEAFSVHL